jgi:hypothetical protein
VSCVASVFGGCCDVALGLHIECQWLYIEH